MKASNTKARASIVRLSAGSLAVVSAVNAMFGLSAHAQVPPSLQRVFWVGGNTGNDGVSGNTATPVVAGNPINNKFENPNNWQNNAPPANTSYFGVHIGSGTATDPDGSMPPDGKFEVHTPGTAVIDQDTMTAFGVPSTGSLSLGYIVLSNGSTNQGTLIMNGGTIAINVSGSSTLLGQLAIGGWSNGGGTAISENGTLLMNGGQITIQPSVLSGAAAVGSLGFELGWSGATNTLSSGTVLMTGGTINVTGCVTGVGYRAALGTFTQSGGVFTTNNVLGLGNGPSATTGGMGVYTLSGTGQVGAATLQFGGNAAAVDVQAISGFANQFNMQGGELSVGVMAVKSTTTAMGESFNYTGGTLTANTIGMTLNQQGGTLSPGTGGTIGGGVGVGSTNLIDLATFASTDLNLPMSAAAGHANYTQAAGAHLLIDLASGNSDPTVSVNDVVHVEDNANGSYATTATLNGEIDLRPANTYTPTIGDKFDIVTADAITDSSVIRLDHLAPNYVFTKALINSSNVPTGFSGGPTTSGQVLEVTFAGHARPGDDTRDATIDSNDFAMLAAHYNQSSNVGWGDGDFNGDGIVNALDFNALATNYGKGGTVENPIGADLPDNAVALGSVVPEPVSASMLLAIGGIGLMGRNRRRKI